MTDHGAIRRAEEALDGGADPREILQRFGQQGVRERRLGDLLALLEDYDPGYGAAAVGRWTAELVDTGWLVPGDGGGD